MTVGIKYCGGCNPSYKRVAAVDMIKSGLRSCKFELYRPDETFDYVLVICGCTKACVKLNKPKAGEVIVIKSESEAKAAIETIANATRKTED